MQSLPAALQQRKVVHCFSKAASLCFSCMIKQLVQRLSLQASLMASHCDLVLMPCMQCCLQRAYTSTQQQVPSDSGYFACCIAPPPACKLKGEYKLHVCT
jgi:hypothetical protein